MLGDFLGNWVFNTEMLPKFRYHASKSEHFYETFSKGAGWFFEKTKIVLKRSNFHLIFIQIRQNEHILLMIDTNTSNVYISQQFFNGWKSIFFKQKLSGNLQFAPHFHLYFLHNLSVNLGSNSKCSEMSMKLSDSKFIFFFQHFRQVCSIWNCSAPVLARPGVFRSSYTECLIVSVH